MARRKAATSNRRPSKRSGKKKESPGWVWAIAGLSVGLLIATFVWLSSIQKPGGSATSKADPMIIVSPAVKTKPATRQAEKQASKKQQAEKSASKAAGMPPSPVIEPPPADKKYDFYDMLPKQTVDIPSDQYRGKDKMQPLLQAEKKVRSGKSGQYILQAGSFRQLKDADRRRAQLALMSVESRIEKVRVNDGYWHRVRIGPFKRLEDANRLRTRLHSENIQTMLVNTGK